MLSKDIKVRHIRDLENYDRVMTLVTRMDTDGKVEYAYAVNKPTEWVSLAETSDFRSEHLVKGDQFSRRKGREIALGRLACARTRAVVEVSAEEHPYRSVLTHIAENNTGLVQRMAEYELEDFELLQQFKATAFAEE